MKCQECKKEIGSQITNEHLLSCSGLTVQEYAIRHHLPLDLILSTEQINLKDSITSYKQPKKINNQIASDILAGLYMANAIEIQDKFSIVILGIRRLEQLLWYLSILQPIGFKYRQEYLYEDSSHRVIAKNCIKIPTSFLPPRVINSSIDSFLQQLTVLIAHIGELHAGYMFIDFPYHDDAVRIEKELTNNFQIRFKILDVSEYPNGRLLRCDTLEDTDRLLKLTSNRLKEIPNARERFFGDNEHATVVKELTFDSAHFITDHPDKCVNLHGGRYAMNVKVNDRIDPLTGFVMDYGYLKRISKQIIIQDLDHHNLNYTASELSWRSSTELLSIYIWEKLIEYIPGLCELQIYETSQSHCVFKGPNLQELQKKGRSALLKYFTADSLGKSQLRDLLNNENPRRLKSIG